jgi:hypothetical protein
MKTKRKGNVRELSRVEGRALLDRQARRELRMSGETFVRRWESGEFRNPDSPKVMRVAMLIPFTK